jgi:hypothetical protein
LVKSIIVRVAENARDASSVKPRTTAPAIAAAPDVDTRQLRIAASPRWRGSADPAWPISRLAPGQPQHWVSANSAAAGGGGSDRPNRAPQRALAARRRMDLSGRLSAAAAAGVRFSDQLEKSRERRRLGAA